MEAALASGNEHDAMLLAYAVALAEPDKGQQILEKYRWYHGMKRPALAVRWGIGVEYTKPANFSGGAMPIGTKQNLPQRRGSRRGGGDFGEVPGGQPGVPGGFEGGAGYGGDPGMGGGGSGFKSLTGELGDKVVEELRKRRESGAFGDWIKTAPRARQGGAMGGYGPAGGYGPGGGYAPAGDPAGFAGGVPDGAGIPGVPGGAGMPGDPGGAGIPGVPGGEFGGGYGPQAGGGASRPGQLMPGVTYLGEADSRELLKQAAAQGIDALLIFDVQVTRNPRNNLVYNDTKIELYDVATGKRIEGSKKLNNVAIQQERDGGSKSDPVAKEIEDLFKVVDLGYRANELPAALLPEHVQRRIGQLTADQHANPLWVLAEARFYNFRQLLGDVELKDAYAALVGADGAEALQSGGVEQRVRVIEKWLPKPAAGARH